MNDEFKTVSVNEVKEFLGIDFDDDFSNNNIKRFIDVANNYLLSAIDKIPNNDERVKQLALFIIEDLYDRNSYTVKENSNITKLRQSLLLQLQCEAYGDLQ